MSVLASIWGWLVKNPAFGVLAILAVHVGVHQFVIDPALRAERDEAREDVGEWKAATARWREATFAWKGTFGRFVIDVREQRAAAAAADRRNVARIAQEQSVIVERTRDAYEDRLADARDAERELRHRLERATDPSARDGGGGAANLPGPYDARCRAYGAADCDAFFAALPGQLAAAEENTAKLIGLQEHVRGLMAIDWSGVATPVQAEEPNRAVE